MKLKLLTLLVAVGLGAATPAVLAQQDGSARIEVEKPQLPQSDQGNHGHPDRPDKPEKPNVPRPGKDVVKQLVRDFRTKAEEYKLQQQELTKKLKDATADDRAKVREQMKQLLNDYQEMKDQFRDQIKDQAHKVKEQRKLDAEQQNQGHGHGKER
jgi:hypothetical protein